MSASFTILPIIAPARSVTDASNHDLTHILRAFLDRPRLRNTRRQRRELSRRNRDQQSSPPPNFWACHGRELLGVAVLVAGLLVVLWPDTLLPLAIASLILGLTLLVALVVFLAWRGRPPR